MFWRAATASGLSRLMRNVPSSLLPLTIWPPIVMKRVYQSTRKAVTSAEAPTMALPATSPLVRALAASR